MNDTNFVNCTGLDDDPAAQEHLTSAYDIALMSRELMKNHPEIQKFTTPYVTNVTAQYVTGPEQVKELLVSQVSSSVRWQQCVEQMIDDGTNQHFISSGRGQTTAGQNSRFAVSVEALHLAAELYKAGRYTTDQRRRGIDLIFLGGQILHIDLTTGIPLG